MIKYSEKYSGDPLQTAAFKGNESLVNLLLDHGADIKAPEGDNGQSVKLSPRSLFLTYFRFLP
jgi:hypothetical protein